MMKCLPVLLLLFFLGETLSTLSATTVFVDPSADACSDLFCGLSSCPCTTIQQSLISAYHYINDTSTTYSSITIMCSPGTYSGPGNSNLNFSSPLSIILQSQEGPQSTILSPDTDAFLFYFPNTGVNNTIQGFQVKQSNSTHSQPLITASNANISFIDFSLSNIISELPLIIANRSALTFSSCALSNNTNMYNNELLLQAEECDIEFSECDISGNLGNYNIISVLLSSVTIVDCMIVSNWAADNIFIIGDSGIATSVITSSLTITNSLIRDNYSRLSLMDADSADILFRNNSILHNIATSALIYSRFSSWQIDYCTVDNNILDNGGFYIDGYNTARGNDSVSSLSVSVTYTTFSGNLLATFPLFVAIDIPLTMLQCVWTNNQDLYGADSGSFLLLQYQTTLSSYTSTLVLDSNLFADNSNSKDLDSNLISIDMVTEPFTISNTMFSNNTGNFPAINILSPSSGQGTFANLTMKDNTGGIYVRGNVTLLDSYITGCSAAVVKIFGYCEFHNVTITENYNPNLNEALIEVGIEVGNTAANRSLFVYDSTITSNSGATGVIQIAHSEFQFHDSMFLMNNSSYISGCITSIASSLVFTDSEFRINESPLGGVFSLVNSQLTTETCVFEENKAFFGGVGFIDDNSNVIMRNSSVSSNVASERGGGFLIQGSGSLENVIFYNNSAYSQGGAISFAGHSSLVVSSSVFDGNWGGSGGALAFTSMATPTILASHFRYNNATSGGGAIILSGNAFPLFEDCVFDSNEATSIGGAATITESSSPTFTRCNFTNNYSPNEAGGLHCTDETFLVMTDCILEGNIAGASGGAFAFGVSASGYISHSSINENTATSKGGGIACYNNCHPTFDNILLKENVAGSGAALWITDSADPAITSSLFAGNHAASIGGAVLSSDRAEGFINDSWFVENGAASGAGGGVMVQDFSVTEFLNCTFTANFAQNGGGLFSSADEGPRVLNSSFALNVAFINGGAIALAENCSAVMANIACDINRAHGSGGCLFLSDISRPIINNITVTDNVAASFGGGMIVSDQSKPIIMGSTFSQNVATSGGGCMVEQTGGGLIENSIFSDNIVVAFGGGILYQGATLAMRDIQVFNNSASSGGGICIDGTTSAFLNRTICESCNITANRADRGGGIYVELSTTNLYSEDYSLPTVSSTHTFVNSKIYRNLGNYGAGIYYSPTTAPTVSFFQATIIDNIANRFGGGVYIAQITNVDENNDAWIFEGHIADNHAFYAGYNVAWKTLSNTREPESFCLNCTIVGSYQKIGYSNAKGFATAPETINFLQECPSSVNLEGETFTVSIEMFDAFGTPVNGTILVRNEFEVTVSSSGGSNCNFNNGTQEGSFSTSSASVEFSGLSFNAKNGSSCPLRFMVSSEPLITDIPPLICKIEVYGCPTDYNIVKEDPYDICEYSTPRRFDTTTILVFVIIGLLLLILCFVIISLTFYGISLRKKQIQYRLAHTEIPDFVDGRPCVTLDDILKDTNIPRIPYEEIEIGARLGVGGSGIVFQAVWRKHMEEPVEIAMKELLFGIHELHEESLQEFLVEIKLMSALKDDNIVEFLGIVVVPEGDKLYLVTEIMHQGNLRDVLDRKGKNLPWNIRLKLAKDAAKGMAYLHSRNIIHRDLKPQNLLVNQNWCCKIADFGISTVSSHTTHMTCIGTPIYMAPEVLSKDKYSEKADVFSFGVLLVEIYTGERPYTSEAFAGFNQAQLMYQIVNNGARPDISNLPVALQQLVADCWSDDLRLRPSFTEIVVRLRRLANLELPHEIEVKPYVEEKDEEPLITDSLTDTQYSNSYFTIEDRGVTLSPIRSNIN